MKHIWNDGTLNIKGLSKEQVLASRMQHGLNSLDYKKTNPVFDAIRSLIKEPMILLLLLASVIYFLSGETGDGIFLSFAILIVSVITLFQDSRSRNALEKLKQLTQPNCTVIREGATIELKSEELVVGDSLIVEEGTFIPADGIIVHSNDFSVDESILTGESFTIFKSKEANDQNIYQGTTVASGLAIVTVTAIGNQTKLGKIGKSLEQIVEEKTPLEVQINNFVKKLVAAGVIVFLIVWGINYAHSRNVLDSLLKALTLAMSILPEEIPMAFTTFMAIGAWRLMKMGIVVKQMKTVETLGSATVICTDKTGTLTENKMSLAKIFQLQAGRIVSPEESLNEQEQQLIRLSMWASEPIPFDPMEKALHENYQRLYRVDERPDYVLVHEYPLGGKPPMMTHIFEDDSGNRIIAAKGAPEALIALAGLTDEEIKNVENAINHLTSDGYRVLAVGEAHFEDKDYPATQQEFQFSFKGIVAFYDPPKKNIQRVLADFYKAGISVKIITGDNAQTTIAIANQIGFNGAGYNLSGADLMLLSEKELEDQVMQVNIFTRMFPEAKLRIIEALKAKGQIVAMTGDGVNDGPALKAAHIGIAMGKKGTEIAKQAASFILIEDDLSKMVYAVGMGRRIHTNLKKAIRYIISIHIPIILTVFTPLILGWIYPNIFSPVHIIFLELIMGPTCSIIFENEQMEQNALTQKPKSLNADFFSIKELIQSIAQGLIITAGILFIYQYSVRHNANEAHTRTLVFLVLISANIFLTLVNRSFYYSIFTTIRYKNNLVPLIIGITLVLTSLLLFIPTLSHFFGFGRISITEAGLCSGIAFVCVFWVELLKLHRQ